MHTELSVHQLAAVIPGSWRVLATNMKYWVNPVPRVPRFHFEMASTASLAFAERLEYMGPDGKVRTVVGHTQWADGVFVWRGTGLRKPLTGQWSVSGVSDDASVMCLRHHKTMLVAAGFSVLVREGVDASELRSDVANHAEAYGVTMEDFASLTWLRGE